MLQSHVGGVHAAHHPCELARPFRRVQQVDVAGRDVARRVLVDDEMVVGERRHLGHVGDDEHLRVPREPRQPTSDLDSSAAYGLHIQGQTVMWWLARSEEARMALTADRLPLDEALRQFARYLASLDEPDIWGNGATFDNVILANAYQAVGLERPWSYKRDRDVRTIEAAGQGICDAADTLERQGTHHHALDDAIHQARVVSAIWQALRWGEPAQDRRL